MNAKTREFKESPLYQGVDESIVHSVTTTPWGSSPSSIVVKLYEFGGGGPEIAASWSDVSSTKLTGSASAAGDVITLPAISGLEVGKTYRVEVKFVSGGKTLEAFGIIYGQR